MINYVIFFIALQYYDEKELEPILRPSRSLISKQVPINALEDSDQADKKLQAATKRRSLMSDLKPILGSAGQDIGFYGILTGSSGHKFALWKLTTYGITPQEYSSKFLDLVSMAKNNTVENLIYDFSENGGGTIISGHLGKHMANFLL